MRLSAIGEKSEIEINSTHGEEKKEQHLCIDIVGNRTCYSINVGGHLNSICENKKRKRDGWVNR